MISFLEPRGFTNELTDIEQVLPFYDQYQFLDGLSTCDAFIYDILKPKTSGNSYHHAESLVSLAVMAFDLNLPQSKDATATCAALVLKKMTPEEKETVQKLLPLVEDQDTVLLSLIHIVKGRHASNMTIEQVRETAKADSFPGDFLLKTKHFKEIDDLIETVEVKGLYISAMDGGPDCINGQYDRIFCSHIDMPNSGATRFEYQKKRANFHSDPRVAINAMDPFGFTWEMSIFPLSCQGNEEEPRRVRVLQRWDCGYSSPFPPKHGWATVEGESQISQVAYSFRGKR